MKYKLLAVGTDTEIFWRHRITGKPMPCIGLVGGTKQEPKPIFGGNGYAVQEDNVMAEFNVPPATDGKAFSKSIQIVLDYLKKEAAKNNCDLLIAPSAHFTKNQLAHPQAQSIGCEPDFCVWTRSENEFDVTKKKILEYLRTAGGHLHVSFSVNGKVNKELTMESKEMVIIFLDLFLGVPGTIFDRDKERKLLYGKPGAFRPKDYGVEWRVFSNWWVQKPEYREWVFSNINIAFDYMNIKNFVGKVLDRGNEIVEIINNQDELKAKRMCKSFGIALPE
jgi:hypothetical protein